MKPPAHPAVRRDDEEVTIKRLVLVLTGLAVAGLAGTLTFLRWDKADHLLSVVSGLATVASLGVAVWAALPDGNSITVKVGNTGTAKATGPGKANTGITGPADGLTGSIELNNSGMAEADGGGEANTGINLN